MKLMSSSIAALTIFFFLLMPPVPAFSWNQEPHKQINFEGVKVFLNDYALSDMEKYRLGRFDRRSVTEPYTGIAVTSRSLLIDPWLGFARYQIGEATKTMPQWIAYGGDWADEPHLYSSVRHFYDPLAMWGQAYLTDQFQFHGWYDDPNIDARTWAIDHHDNPFSFINAMVYYKAAMETPETWKNTGQQLAPYHFKLNLSLDPKDPADRRGIYLAMAYRALGETMHLLGDMTQPAHVRNDSHPIDEPIEKALSSRDVRHAADYPIVDERIAPYLKSAGGTLHSPAEIFREVALFTNQNFYSLDTIYDAEENVIPNNIVLQQPAIPLDILMNFRPPYPSPQFKDLIEEKTLVSGWIRNTKREVKQLSGAFTVGKIPMAQQRLSLYWFDPDMETLEMIARLKGLGPYHIPPSYAEKKSWVLMPIAIHACADLMHHFFPTLELTTEYADLGIVPENVPGRDDYQRKVVEIDSTMIHHQDQDMAWSEKNLEIKYSGPAKLIFTRDDRIVKTRSLHFLNGHLDKIENHEKKMVDAPLRVYVSIAGIPLTTEEAFYEADNEENLYLEIQAGSRTFRSKEFEVEKEASISIQPPRIVIYELTDGATQVEHEFEAYFTPEGRYSFFWDFGDGQTDDFAIKTISDRVVVKHTYKNLKDGDVFYPSVKLYSQDGILLAEDAITINVVAEDNDAIDTSLAEHCGFTPDFSKLRYDDRYSNVPGNDQLLDEDGRVVIAVSWLNSDQPGQVRCYDHDEGKLLWTNWHNNGAKESITPYTKGQDGNYAMDGLVVKWYENGGLMSETTYIMGLRSGPARSWHDCGHPSAVGQYGYNGTYYAQVGVWEYWVREGAGPDYIYRQSYYDYGPPVPH